MKIRNLFFASLAALTFAACSNDDAPTPEAGVTFKLATSSAVVKADPESPTVTGEAAINSAFIYIYEKGAGAEYTYRDALPLNIVAGSASLTTLLPEGQYQVFAAVNAPDGLTATTLEELKDNVITLSANKKDGFVMFGEGQPITVDKDGSGTNLDQTITVTRIVAGIQIGVLTFNLPGDVFPVYKEAVDANKVKIVSFKIKNSPTNAVLSTGASSGDPSYIKDLMFAEYKGSTMENKVLTNLSKSSADRIYSYAQGSSTTELQLCLQFEGADTPSYYNIALGTELKSNYMYTLNAQITGTGSSTDQGKDGITKFSLLVQNWRDGGVIEGGPVGN